jgi:hypothetical protein
MAKSKVGGSRAYIRGRIGADVYSIGKDGKGSRQQVVRSLAEQVSNPRTQSQMFGRMVMSTVMQAVSAFKPIIDHSFDGLPVGQPSISEFIRRNYALVKADAIAHPASGNAFGLCKYQEKGIKGGKYIVSAGDIVVPAALSIDTAGITIVLTDSTLTVGGLKAALGISGEEYVTYIGIAEGGSAVFTRLKVNSTLADTTAITAENVKTLFETEGNLPVNFELNEHVISIMENTTAGLANFGMILSKKENSAWAHSACTLDGSSNVEFNSDAALPTYPTGTQQFLNGGDL